MADARLVNLSKLMSLVLRHEPDRFGLVLDAEGYVPIEDLVEALRRERTVVTAEDIRAVVSTVEPGKQRFAIEEGEIRANYGHSIEAKIRQQVAVPPDFLLHGTVESTLPSILAHGLRPMKRQYVHLTTDSSLALRIGQRRGKPRLVRVSAKAAHEDGIHFYRANAAFWLADEIPPIYLSTPG